MTDSRIAVHVSEFGEWEAVHRAPDVRLAPYVTRLSGWWERTTFTRRREVPHPGAVLIINVENRLGVSSSGSGLAAERYHAFFAGMHSSFVVTESSGIGGGIQVDFTPIGAYRFAGVPASELTDATVHLDVVLGGEARLLTERIELARSWEERFDLVEGAILARLAGGPVPSEGVAWAWGRMQAAQGLVSIGSLASALSWTPRQLIEGFRREIGLPPKQMARILRFDRAAGMLKPDEAPCLAGIAAECGYYDQAHFTREFRQFAGSTPTQFFERLIPASGGLLDEEPGEGISYKTPSPVAG